MSRWAYPAGVREDTTMHGSAVSQERWLWGESKETDREASEPRAYVQHGEEVALCQLRADWVTYMSMQWEAERALYNSWQMANHPSETPLISRGAFFISHQHQRSIMVLQIPSLPGTSAAFRRVWTGPYSRPSTRAGGTSTALRTKKI